MQKTIGQPMPSEEATKYTAMVAAWNLFDSDRADSGTGAAKAPSRLMPKPCKDDPETIARIGKYPICGPAGRRAEEYCSIAQRGCMVKHWPSAQNPNALSSTEGELHTATRVCSEAKVVKSLGENLGEDLCIRGFVLLRPR